MSTPTIYECRTLWWTQRFTLLADELQIESSQRLTGSSRATHSLRSLTTTPTRGWSRPQGFTLGAFVAGVAFGLSLYWVFTNGFSLGEHGPATFAVVGVAGVVWAICSRRRWEYAQFVSDAGIPVVTIWGPPKTAPTFQPFIDALTSQIRAARGTA